MLWKLLKRPDAFLNPKGDCFGSLLFAFLNRMLCTGLQFLQPVFLQKRIAVMVIMNKKHRCGMDIFSKSFAGYVLEFFVDSAKMRLAIFGINNLKRGILMLLLFFLAWIIFNGRVTLEIVLFGIVISLAVFAFICKFMDFSIQRERNFYRRLPQYLQYFYVLIKEIISANLTVCRMILTRKETMEPVLVRVHVNLKTETARVILANSITLTPGTITVSMTGQELLVHCLDKSLSEGMEDSVFVKLLQKMEREDA